MCEDSGGRSWHANRSARIDSTHYVHCELLSRAAQPELPFAADRGADCGRRVHRHRTRRMGSARVVSRPKGTISHIRIFTLQNIDTVHTKY